MRSLDTVFLGFMLMLFFASKIIPVLAWISAYMLYVILGVFSYWLPRKYVIVSIAIIEIELAIRLCFMYNWWTVADAFNHWLTTWVGTPLLSQPETMSWLIVGMAYTFFTRIIAYHLAKKRVGKKIRDLLPNLYNMN